MRLCNMFSGNSLEIGPARKLRGVECTFGGRSASRFRGRQMRCCSVQRQGGATAPVMLLLLLTGANQELGGPVRQWTVPRRRWLLLRVKNSGLHQGLHQIRPDLQANCGAAFCVHVGRGHGLWRQRPRLHRDPDLLLPHPQGIPPLCLPPGFPLPPVFSANSLVHCWCIAFDVALSLLAVQDTCCNLVHSPATKEQPRPPPIP